MSLNLDCTCDVVSTVFVVFDHERNLYMRVFLEPVAVTMLGFPRQFDRQQFADLVKTPGVSVDCVAPVDRPLLDQ